MFAMWRRCALLGIRDPALQCKLFDTLVLPILSYGAEVWGVPGSFVEAAEAVHRNFVGDSEVHNKRDCSGRAGLLSAA